MCTPYRFTAITRRYRELFWSIVNAGVNVCVKCAQYITAMTTDLPGALAVDCCGLDPLFNSCLKLYICDVLTMREHDSDLGDLLRFLPVIEGMTRCTDDCVKLAQRSRLLLR